MFRRPFHGARILHQEKMIYIILGIILFAIDRHLKVRLKNRGIEYNELGRWDKTKRKYKQLW